jgi:hypothetical protein
MNPYSRINKEKIVYLIENYKNKMVGFPKFTYSFDEPTELGCYSYRYGKITNINFNVYLEKFPVYLVHEIILHEMCHIANIGTEWDCEYYAYKDSLTILQQEHPNYYKEAIKRHLLTLSKIKRTSLEHYKAIRRYLWEVSHEDRA